MDKQLYKLVVRWRDGQFANITVTQIVRENDVVFAYFCDDFVGMFDLGAAEALYVNPWYGGGAQRD